LSFPQSISVNAERISVNVDIAECYVRISVAFLLHTDTSGQAHIHLDTHTSGQAHIHLDTHTSGQAHTHIWTSTHTSGHILTHTHIWTHRHTHTHTPPVHLSLTSHCTDDRLPALPCCAAQLSYTVRCYAYITCFRAVATWPQSNVTDCRVVARLQEAIPCVFEGNYEDMFTIAAA
jgi:hypothetical protein